MKKKEFQEIFATSFSDPVAWRQWFFSDVVTDEEQIYIGRDPSNRAQSALLMQPYGFAYQGQILPCEYMSCVATRPEARSKGIASALIRDALADSRRRGVALCALIPAQPHLIYFYQKSGFAQVVYVDRKRFTALHAFEGGEGELTAPDYAILSRLESKQPCCVLHSEADYRNIMADLKLDGGHAVAARTEAGDEAILFAAEYDGVCKIKSLLYDNEAVARKALAGLRELVGDKAVVVNAPPVSSAKWYLRPYGMVRILDPGQVLGAVAAANPSLRYTVKLTDTLLPENDGMYIIRDGRCSHTEYKTGRCDLEVHAPTLTSVLFSEPEIAGIFDLPGVRPYMSLMLD